MVLLAQAAGSLLVYRNVALKGADRGGSTITLSMPRSMLSRKSMLYQGSDCSFLME